MTKFTTILKKGAYKETDILGGKILTALKASAEIAIKSYFETYLKAKKNINLAVARAGNVIGGGDWSEGRLIPDCVRAWSKKYCKNKKPTFHKALAACNGSCIWVYSISFKIEKK